jgi:hypothetical protein
VIRETFRLLCPGGRLVIYNLCPQECRDWLYYRYFPEALARDLADFWSPDAITAEISATGFAPVAVEPQHLHFEHDLRDLLTAVKRRDSNSQLMTLSDDTYAAGLMRIERELPNPSEARFRADHICFLTLRADKPVMMT